MSSCVLDSQEEGAAPLEQLVKPSWVRRQERRVRTRKRHNRRKRAHAVAEARLDSFGRAVKGVRENPVVTEMFGKLVTSAEKLRRKARVPKKPEPSLS